jgi:diacylglycerol O-acyltransferase / wax synthase
VPIYSSGAQLISMHGLLCLTDGLGLGHVVQSYVDQATIGFTACRKLLPDPEFYSACLQQSYDDMLSAALNFGTETSEKPKKQKKQKHPAGVE